MQGISKFILAITVLSRVLFAGPQDAAAPQAAPQTPAPSRAEMTDMVLREVADEGKYIGMAEGSKVSSCNGDLNWCLDGQVIKMGAIRIPGPNGQKPADGVVAFVEDRVTKARKVLAQDESEALFSEINGIKNADKERYKELMTDSRSSALLSVLEGFTNRQWPEKIRKMLMGGSSLQSTPEDLSPGTGPTASPGQGPHGPQTDSRPTGEKTPYESLKSEYDSDKVEDLGKLTPAYMSGVCVQDGKPGPTPLKIDLKFGGEGDSKLVAMDNKFADERFQEGDADHPAADSYGSRCYAFKEKDVLVKRHCIKKRNNAYVIRTVNYGQKDGALTIESIHYCKVIPDPEKSKPETAQLSPASKEPAKKPDEAAKPATVTGEAIVANSIEFQCEGKILMVIKNDENQYTLNNYCGHGAENSAVFSVGAGNALLSHCPGKKAPDISLSLSNKIYTLKLPGAHNCTAAQL